MRSNIEIIKGNIAKFNADAVVNASNGLLRKGGGGVSRAIFDEAGEDELQKACSEIGGCRTGGAVITPGFNLRADYIIHVVGPLWAGGNHGEDKLLYSAYMNALITAKENACRSIAFPLISAGIKGYPKELVWKTAMESCTDFIMDNLDYPISITFVIRGDENRREGMRTLGDIFCERYHKKYPDKGKFAAPRWLVYPELSAWTIGWRMGYGEDYAMNEPYHTKEFSKLFPQPKNWLFNSIKLKGMRIPLLGFLWEENGKPKYSQITGERITVNDFITMDEESEFRNDTFMFKSIEHALLLSKYLLKCGPDESLENLKKGFELNTEELEWWEFFKYSVLLNACYYKVMENERLKEKLLETGDKCLVYESDDEFGGDENLFGFALMEMRDELRRLYENENLIDWRYTEYLIIKDPYEQPKPRDPEDRQSAEFKIIESTLDSASKYVRDVNLDEKYVEYYKAHQFITEKAFVDASSKIGGMITSHRYLILSQFMADFSKFEKGTGWGLHTAARNSKFKILDIYEIDGKTQIVLLHLPEGFETVFKNTVSIERELVEELRNEFEETIKLDPVEELTDEMWLERCEFPIGIDD